MNPEELKKVLENAESSVDQKVQGIIDLADAATKGLKEKNQELIGAEKKAKDALDEFKSKAQTAEAKITELTEELKKNSGEERQKYYEAKLQEAQTNFQAELEKVSVERDQFRESHLNRLQQDAISNGIKDLKFADGLKEGYIALVMMRNKFVPKDIDGKIEFLNGENKSIDAVMRDFSLTAEGKAFLQNQSSGGGAAPAPKPNNGSPAPAGSVTRAEFEAMPPQSQMEFISKGGKVA
jgi:polyribonucleotide nucleotidyltransferase